jgi:putative PIN family toxin of toxin-antitoxin system
VTERPRYLLDTETLIRAFRSDGPARELLQRGMVRDLSLTTSTTILDELDEVLARPKFGIAPGDRSEIRRLLLVAADEMADFEEADAARHVPSDPGDDHVVEAALRTRASLLVTKDPDFKEVTDPPFGVLGDGEACEHFRKGVPYGHLLLLSPQDQQAQRRRLASSRTGGDGLRRGAYDSFRELTSSFALTDVSEEASACLLGPEETAELATGLVRACGQGLSLDIRDGGNFDYLSGTRYDVPSADAPAALDLIWYSSERARAEAIAQPKAPTVANFGWADDHRHRVVLAGGILVVAAVRGPEDEPDLRLLVPVAEPLAATPKIKNDYRIAYTGRSATSLHVVSLDPAGFSSSTSTWLAGGPSAILTPTALPPDALIIAFLTADRASRGFGLPVPLPAVLEAELPDEFHDMIVR